MGFIRSPLIYVIQENFITRPDIKHGYLWMISESCSKGKFMYINVYRSTHRHLNFYQALLKYKIKKFYPYHKKQVPVLDRAVETIPRETYTMYTGPTLWPQGFCSCFVFDNLICLSEVDKAYSTNLGTQCLWPANVFCPWALVIFAWASAFLSISHNMYGKRDLLFFRRGINSVRLLLGIAVRVICPYLTWLWQSSCRFSIIVAGQCRPV